MNMTKTTQQIVFDNLDNLSGTYQLKKWDMIWIPLKVVMEAIEQSDTGVDGDTVWKSTLLEKLGLRESVTTRRDKK